jgi:hypothetical protein
MTSVSLFRALCTFGAVVVTACDFEESRVEQRLREIPEVATVHVEDIGEWSTYLLAIVGDAKGCEIAFYGVRDESFDKADPLMVTHIGQWKLACFAPPSAIDYAANLADGPNSIAKGMGISNIREAVRACGQLEHLVSALPHTSQEVEGKPGACFSTPENPRDSYVH